MWSALLGIALAAMPAAAGQLEFGNVRGIYGPFGPTRKDAKFQPGDVVCVGFDILGLSSDKKGRIAFTAALEVKNDKGELKVQKKLADITFHNTLAGKEVPHLVELPLALDAPPGKFTLKVTVTDLISNTTGEFSRAFEVFPPDLALVRCQMTYDIGGSIRTSNVGTLGQVLYLNTVVVGFKRDRAKGNQGAISVEMTILDGDGRPVVTKPVRFPEGSKPQVIPEDAGFWHVQFDLPLNRVGEFTAQLKATDHVAGKTATLGIPFRSLPSYEGTQK